MHDHSFHGSRSVGYLSFYLLFVNLIFGHFAMVANATVDTEKSRYKKPSKSRGQCIESIEMMEKAISEGGDVLISNSSNTNGTNINSKSLEHTNHTSDHGLPVYSLCLGCYESSQGECPQSPVPCQKLIDSLYRKCDGVTLPPDYYYNPPENTITGYWYDRDVREELKIAAERCGCNSAPTYKHLISAIVTAACTICYIL